MSIELLLCRHIVRLWPGHTFLPRAVTPASTEQHCQDDTMHPSLISNMSSRGLTGESDERPCQNDGLRLSLMST